MDINTGKCENNQVISDEEKLFYFRCNKTNKEGDACEKCLDGYKLSKMDYVLMIYIVLKKMEMGLAKNVLMMKIIHFVWIIILDVLKVFLIIAYNVMML